MSRNLSRDCACQICEVSLDEASIYVVLLSCSILKLRLHFKLSSVYVSSLRHPYCFLFTLNVSDCVCVCVSVCVCVRHGSELTGLPYTTYFALDLVSWVS